MNERKCKMYDDENCSSTCNDTWPTCNICGKTLDFWNGDEFDEANAYFITQVGTNCDDREEIDWEYRLCPACYERVKEFIEIFKTRSPQNQKEMRCHI